MKKIKEKKSAFIILMMMFTAILSSCSSNSDDSSSSHELNVSTEEIDISSAGGNESFTISGNVDWTISGHENWVQVNPTSGNGNKGVVVNISENTAATARTCTMHVKSTDGSLQKDITIKQNAADGILSSDVSSVNLSSTAGSSQSIAIKANMAWNVTGVANWLNVSALSGTGNTTITVTTKSANESANERKDTLAITSGNNLLKVIITQAAGLSTCTAKPNYLVTLSDQLAYSLSYEGDVKYYLIHLWRKSDLERINDSDILTTLQSQSHDTPDDAFVTSYRGLYPNTEYVLCSVAYDSNGNRGEIVKTPIKTMNSVNIDAEAYITDAKYDSSNFYWTTTKSGYCDSYHMIFGTNVPEEAIKCYSVTYAWIINYYISTGKKGLSKYNYGINIDLVNGDSYVLPYSGTAANAFVATWGKFKNGTMSPTCSYIQGSIQSTSSSARKSLLKAKKSNTQSSGISRITTRISAFRNISFR